MKIDKYTKFILTLIAVGILALNLQIFGGSLVKDAFAKGSSGVIEVGPAGDKFRLVTSDGKFVCQFKKSIIKGYGNWVATGC